MIRLMFKIKTCLFVLCFLLSLSFSFLPASGSAQIHEIRCGANSAATGGDANNNGCAEAPKNAPSLHDIVAKVINLISSLVAVVSVIMIMIGGFRYVTSAGRDDAVKSAKSTIFNAIIGLVIAVFAQIIVRFVISQV
jgi:hypothetical protein